MALIWKCLPFHELNVTQLYAIMRVRQEVFVVEQNCPYLDADGKDQKSWHVMGFDAEGDCVVYARLLPKGVSYPDTTSMGRILTSSKVRGTGIGKIFMKKLMLYHEQLFGRNPIKISAQCYLLKFYQNFGFIENGESYLEDDIPHQEMIYRF